MGPALTAMLDGFLLRSRLQPDEMTSCRWRDASLLTDTIIAFSVGVIDVDGTAGHRAACSTGSSRPNDGQTCRAHRVAASVGSARRAQNYQ